MSLVNQDKLNQLSDFADITVDQLPLVKIRVKKKVPTIEAFSLFLECFRDIMNNTTDRIVLLIDLRKGTWGLKTVMIHMPMLLLTLKSLKHRFETHLCCSSVIVEDEYMKSVIDTVPKTRPCNVYADDKDAYGWMKKQLTLPQHKV